MNGISRSESRAKIFVVIPAFRVENHIQNVLANIPDYIDQIIVVNDASPDGTQQIIEAVQDPRVHLVNHEKNQGVGGAMLSGYAAALKMGADIIVKLDGDDQMDPRYIPALLEPILRDQADYTKGNRFLHPVELQKMPLLRRMGNLGLTFMTKLASGYWNVFDPTNGYTAIRAEMLQNINPYRVAKNYFFETSMLCELRRANAVVMDIAIPARYQNEKSSMNVFQQLFIFQTNLTSRFFKRLLTQYYLYDFNAVSLYLIMGVVLGLFGTIWGIVKWVQSSESGIPASTGTVLLAVLPIILAVQFLVQAIAQDISNSPSHVTHYSKGEGQLALWNNYHK